VKEDGRVRRRRTPRDELAEATTHGEVYLRRLVRAQLALSISALVAFIGLLGALPLLLFLVPHLASISVIGIPLPLLLVAFPLFPLFVAIGWTYQRRADGLDEAFRDLVGGP
jgi:O-antigen/teichoic acid export membrane protein